MSDWEPPEGKTFPQLVRERYREKFGQEAPERDDPFREAEFLRKFGPHSLSPDHEGFRRTEGLTFAEAVEAMQEGHRVIRTAHKELDFDASVGAFDLQSGNGCYTLLMEDFTATDWEIVW